MDIKPVGPGKIGFGNVDETPSTNAAKSTFPTLRSTAAEETGKPLAAELEALAGLGKPEDLNDPEKSRAIVRNALSILSGPELSQLTQKEKDSLTDWMANDPSIQSRTL